MSGLGRKHIAKSADFEDVGFAELRIIFVKLKSAIEFISSLIIIISIFINKK